MSDTGRERRPIDSTTMNQAAALPALPVRSPSLTLFGTEPVRAALEFLSHKLARSPSHAPGDGHPVILFPGLGAGATSLAPLRNHCRALGYEAMDWGRGYNTGPNSDVDQWLGELAQHVSGLLDTCPQSASLVGWSLGGLYARELAKLLGPRVRQVITIGTPFNAELDHTNVGWIYRLLSGSSAQLNPALSRRLRTAPSVPTTSIYSRTDGVVAWQTCRHDKPGRRVQDVEVQGSHLGMGWNQQVLHVVADCLALRPGQWRPYVEGAA